MNKAVIGMHFEDMVAAIRKSDPRCNDVPEYALKAVLAAGAAAAVYYAAPVKTFEIETLASQAQYLAESLLRTAGYNDEAQKFIFHAADVVLANVVEKAAHELKLSEAEISPPSTIQES